ncbi:hypothetical protein ACHAXT_010627 [Thalassiosira profunda]
MHGCIALALVAAALPLASSQPAPWDVQFLGLSADFGAPSGEEVALTYSIGKNRAYATEIWATDCVSAVTGANVTLTDTRSALDSSLDALELAYDIDTSTLAGSNIWNEAANQLEFCQVVQLTIPATGGTPLLVIAEDVRRFDIDLDLSVEFSLDNNNLPLGDGTINNETGVANVTNTVESCKCTGLDDFTCNTDPLVPNTELFVCISGTSDGMEVDFLDSMVLVQGATTLAVVKNDTIAFPSITSRAYVAAENGVSVSTRVPANLFDYSSGSSISISGVIDMKLAGGFSSRRRLKVSVGGDEDDGNDIESPYHLEVALQKATVYVEEEDPTPNSANAVATAGLTIVGALLAVAQTM